MTSNRSPKLDAPLWHVPAPRHFDLHIPWWIKLAVMLALMTIAFFFDAPIARWVIANHPLQVKEDLDHELIHLEQFGQVACSIFVIAAVALIDKEGRRKALALANACLLTAVASHFIKGVMGRGRPLVFFIPGNPLHQEWHNLGFLGMGLGFIKHYDYGSFPSAHTTGAFALATGLSWFYPRARGLFITLALITAGERVLHHAHFVSDTIAGMILAVCIVRLCLGFNFSGRLIALMPAPLRTWWLSDN